MKKLFSALACVLLLCGPAHAAVLSFEYTAVVSFGVSSDENGDDWNVARINGAEIVAGNTVRGSFSYDTSTPVWFQWKPTDTYFLGGGSMSLLVLENGFSFNSTAADLPQMAVLNDSTSYGGTMDSFSITSHTYYENAVPPLVATFSMFDYSGSAFSSGGLPTEFDVSRFQQKSVNLTYTHGDYTNQFDANITSLRLVNDVPEPATMATLISGLVLLFALRQLRRKPDGRRPAC